MSRYTTQIRNVIESGYDVMPKEYDFYDPSHKAKFESMFIDHYYFNEIGQETIGLFRHMLRSHLNMVMPKYKMLFESKLNTYDPMLLVNYKEVSKREGEGSTVGKSESTDKGQGESTSFSATIPQSGLSGKGLENYMKDADKGQSNSTSSASGKTDQSAKSLEDYIREVYGSYGMSRAKQVQEIRDLYVNIDKEIIESCRDLFMLIY